MPQISYFYGIIIYLYYEEHNPPHIHAIYSGYKATYEIKTGKRLTGNMANTADKLVKKWIKLRDKELLKVWKLAMDKVSPLPSVEPLD
ncbi:MAG: DUF4160 domain-containing protein [Pseudomonadota bacterium]